jgi:hypothetical protein
MPFRTVANAEDSTSSADGFENIDCGIWANGETPLLQRPSLGKNEWLWHNRIAHRSSKSGVAGSSPASHAKLAFVR